MELANPLRQVEMIALRVIGATFRMKKVLCTASIHVPEDGIRPVLLIQRRLQKHARCVQKVTIAKGLILISNNACLVTTVHRIQTDQQSIHVQLGLINQILAKLRTVIASLARLPIIVPQVLLSPFLVILGTTAAQQESKTIKLIHAKVAPTNQVQGRHHVSIALKVRIVQLAQLIQCFVRLVHTMIRLIRIQSLIANYVQPITCVPYLD